MTGRLEGKVAIITGGTSGIGRGTVDLFLKEGAKVVAGDLQDHKGEAMERELGPNFSYCRANVAVEAEVKNLVDHTVKKFGRLDVLFNNAGVGTPPVPLEDLTLQQWQTTVATNLTAPFLCTQHAFRIMKNQTPRGGRIINNGSISAYAPRPFSSPYTSTKHAISGLTRATALDGRAYDIACGQIDIGNAATEMTERMTGGVLQPRGDSMVEPRMDVQNVADAIVFMATRSLDANALFLNIMATKMPFVGRG